MIENTRRFPRVPFRTRVHCIGNGLYFSDLTLNLSEGGLGLQTISSLKPGEELEIEFQLPNTERGVVVRTQVVWVEPMNQGSYRMQCGVKFQELDKDCRRLLRSYIANNLG